MWLYTTGLTKIIRRSKSTNFHGFFPFCSILQHQCGALHDDVEIITRFSLPHDGLTVLKWHRFQCISNCKTLPLIQTLCKERNSLTAKQKTLPQNSEHHLVCTLHLKEKNMGESKMQNAWLFLGQIYLLYITKTYFTNNNNNNNNNRNEVPCSLINKPWSLTNLLFSTLRWSQKDHNLRTDVMKSVMKLDKEGIQVLLVIIQFKELHPCLLSRTLKTDRQTDTHTHTQPATDTSTLIN